MNTCSQNIAWVSFNSSHLNHLIISYSNAFEISAELYNEN